MCFVYIYIYIYIYAHYSQALIIFIDFKQKMHAQNKSCLRWLKGSLKMA